MNILKRFKKIYILPLALLILFSGGFLMLKNWAVSPATGTLPEKQNPTSSVQGSTLTLRDFSTSEFSTKVNAELIDKTKNTAKQGSITGQFLLSNKSIEVNDQLAVTIGLADSNDISELSAVKFRLSQPETYKTEPAPAGYPINSVVFISTNDGFEKGVFWIENNRFAQVVGTGRLNTRAKIITSTDTAVLNWQWSEQ